MPRNGAGTYSQPAGTAAIPSATIASAPYNSLIADLGNEITNSINVSGTKAMSAALPMGGFRVTNMADPGAAQDAVTRAYADANYGALSAVTTYVGGTSTGTANAQVLATLTPSGFTLAAGKRIVFIPGFTNTAATTMTANALPAKNIFKMGPAGAIALSGGEIVASQLTELIYDGTQYILSGNAQNETGPVTTLASAGTTDLGTIPSRNISVTGTTTITAFGSTAQTAFPLYFLTFTGILSLTYNATSLILPGAASITTAAGDTAIAIYIGGGNWQVINYVRATGYPIANNAVAVPNRQTVLAGPGDTNGYPNFWPATSVSLTLTMQNVTTTPLVFTIANGFNAFGQSDLTVQRTTNDAIVLGASVTSYIYYDNTGTLGSTTLVPIYQRGGTISVTNGQHTFDINAGQMYLGNGTTAPATSRVFIGEAVTGVGTVTSTVCYAYQRRFVYTDAGALPGVGTAVSKNSNLGVAFGIEKKLTIINTITNAGYAVGDEVTPATANQAGDDTPFTMVVTKNTLGFVAGASAAWIAANKATGANVVLTAADWVYRLEAWSTW